MNNESLVYLNKVFSDLKIKSCPLMSSLSATSENFDQQLTFTDPQTADCDCGCECDCCRNSCNCGCGCTELDCNDLNFVIDSTEVIVSDFDLTCPGQIDPCNVTVDGIPVDGLEFFNERYMAATNELMTKIGDCACMERGLSTKAYLLISGIGGFNAKLTIILRGSAFGGGTCKKFKLVLTTKKNVFVNIPGQATFATSELCLPCTTGGIAPIINFSFNADATLLNPVIHAAQIGGTCCLTVTGCLVAEPIADVQVTRQTLFRTNAQSVNVPCDDIEKCRQNIGECGMADDDSNAFQLRNRCCDDGRRDDNEENGCSCGCGCNTCDAAPSEPASCGCNNTCSYTNQGRSSRTTSISCQFNGRNGCSF